MTSTIASAADRSPSPAGPERTSAPASLAPSPARAPRRPRSRFPGAGQDRAESPGRPRRGVRWVGPEGPLRELVADHATASGSWLLEEPHETAGCTVVPADALREGAPRSLAAPGRAPLIVVLAAEQVPAELWPLALEAGALAVLPLPSASEELLSRLAELTRTRSGARLIGVTGGCGGAGASTFAARLAGAARRHGPVALLDADPLGGGLDLLVEASGAPGLDWSQTASLGVDDGEALRSGLPRIDEVHLLVAGERPGPDQEDLPRVLAALGPLDGTVVVDLAAALVPCAIPHLDELLLVLPASDLAVRSAARRLREWSPPAGLTRAVVRRGGALSAAEVAEDLDLPLAVSFRDSPRGAVPLLDVRRRGADRAARELLAELLMQEPA
ncbi:hypothetical protein ACFU1Q_05605 [Brachybacterium paraconglomeratum]